MHSRNCLLVPLALALLASGCLQHERKVALPWHGPVTRLVWADVARGTLGTPQCQVWEADDDMQSTGLTRLFNQVTTSDGFMCAYMAPDSLRWAQIYGHAGAVDSYDTHIARPLPGPDGMDSTYQALSALYGPGRRCEFVRLDTGHRGVGASWRAQGYSVGLFPPGVRRQTTRVTGQQALMVSLTTDSLDYCAGRDTLPSNARLGWSPRAPGLDENGRWPDP